MSIGFCSRYGRLLDFEMERLAARIFYNEMCFSEGAFDKSNLIGLSRIPYSQIKFLYPVLDNFDLAAEELGSPLRTKKAWFPTLDTVIGGHHK